MGRDRGDVGSGPTRNWRRTLTLTLALALALTLTQTLTLTRTLPGGGGQEEGLSKVSPSAAYYTACGLFLRFFTDIAVAAAAAAVRPLLPVDERRRGSSKCVERANTLVI